MSAARRRRNYEELRRRVLEVARLGDPRPAVSVEVAGVLVDLLQEFETCLLELELALGAS